MSISEGEYQLRYSDPPEPERDPTWVTKDGRRIPVASMTDAHLVNAIRMMRRKGFCSVNEWWRAAGVAASFGADSMASYYASGEVDSMGARTNSRLDDLLAEADKRGLDP